MTKAPVAGSNLTSCTPAEIDDLKDPLSLLENLPTEVFWQIMEKCDDSVTWARLSATSRTIRATTLEYVENRLRIFDKITEYLPRALKERERNFSPVQKLAILQELINGQDSLGRTPLIKATLAVKTDSIQLDAVRTLIRLGAKIDQQVRQGFTASKFAEYWGIDEVSALLRKNLPQAVA